MPGSGFAGAGIAALGVAGAVPWRGYFDVEDDK
jgi:hypothetical protein